MNQLRENKIKCHQTINYNQNAILYQKIEFDDLNLIYLSFI